MCKRVFRADSLVMTTYWRRKQIQTQNKISGKNLQNGVATLALLPLLSSETSLLNVHSTNHLFSEKSISRHELDLARSVDELSLEILIRKMKAKRSFSHDYMSNFALKAVRQPLLTPLSHLISLSLK